MTKTISNLLVGNDDDDERSYLQFCEAADIIGQFQPRILDNIDPIVPLSTCFKDLV